MSFSGIQDKAIKRRYTDLLVQYEALSDQYDNCLDAGQKAILKNKIDKLQAELEALEKLLENSAAPTLLEKLHYINFKNIIKKFEELLESFGRKGGVSLLVLQDSAAMAGDLLVMRLQEELRRQASNFRYLPVGFSEDNELNELGLLRRLSTHLGVSGNYNDRDKLLDLVIERLCSSLQTRSVVFLEISQWHKLPSQEKVFSWLCQNFYSCLASKLSDAVREKSWRRVYVFLVIVSDDFFPNDCLQATYPFLNSEQNIAEDKEKMIFEIPLENWNIEDIECWLEFSGLPDHQLEDTANRLYRRGRNGIPLIVRDAIEKEFCGA
ncbi:MAG: hypothetical protein F6K19_14690 [Cyanothece sp. SIO1E1]|nr:hypothetical protein [Cyanothece sp. SIO1E1]